MHPIAHIENCYDTKFGIPRQAGLVAAESVIVFEPDYRIAEALRGIETFDYLWLLWLMHEAVRDEWSPTVRPPRLGGNTRMGVFATRSPFRPNNIGLSSVRLIGVEPTTDRGVTLRIEGADLMNGTPILDIKPYLPYTDSHPDARSGFAPAPPAQRLAVHYDSALLNPLTPSQQQTLLDTLALDPRPAYQSSPTRHYVMPFAGHEAVFHVDGTDLYLTDLRQSINQ